MTNPKILVTGATGKTGAPVVAILRERGFPVRAMVRREDARSAKLANLGAEVVVGDLYDYRDVLRAQTGTERAYFLPPVQPFMINAALTFAAAARTSGLRFIAQLSQWLASPAHPSLHTRQLWQVEKLFAQIPGVAHTVINPGFFADNAMQMTGTAANLGVLPNPFGDLRNAPPSNEDIARVVAAVLADPETHVGLRYRPTGPELIGMAEIAAAIGDTVGRPVKLQDLPPKMFLKAAKAMGTSEFEMTNVRHYLEDGKTGAFAINAVTAGIGQLTGRTPETVDVIAKRYASSPKATRTFGNRLREMRGMLGVVTARALDCDAFERRQQYPRPEHPTLAADSATWRREHAQQSGPGVTAPAA